MRFLIASFIVLLIQLCEVDPVVASEDNAQDPAHGLTRPDQNFRSGVDNLFALQDRAAAGSTSSVADQKELLPSLGKTIENIPADQYSASSSLIAAYILSGGDPQVAERASAWKTFSEHDQKLLQASARFMKGEREEAAKFLDNIEALRLPARIVGRVALAKALLSTEEARQTHLEIAVSAMPGTLIEESALRRSALGFADSHEETRFWRRLERYARRFPHSIYASAFWDEVSAKLVSWSTSSLKPDIPRLDLVVSTLPVERRRTIYLSLARRSVEAVRPVLVGFASRRLRRLAVPGSTEDQLGLFYISLYEIVSANGSTALANLKSAPRSLLNPMELSLLDAAITVGNQIESPLPALDSSMPEPQEDSGTEKRGKELLTQSYKTIAELN